MRILLGAFAMATVGAVLPVPAIEQSAKLLSPAVALLATSIFPCMTLAVGAMKADGRTPQLVNQLYDNLRALITLLIVTFAVAATVIGLCLICVAVVETDALLPPVQYYGTKALGAAIGTALAIFIGRVSAIGRSFIAILDINHKQAMLIARGKSKADLDQALSAMSIGPTKPVEVRPLTRVK